MMTSAQAEGAIEGVYTDYKLPSTFSTDFKFSRYALIARAPVAPVQRVDTFLVAGRERVTRRVASLADRGPSTR